MARALHLHTVSGPEWGSREPPERVVRWEVAMATIHSRKGDDLMEMNVKHRVASGALALALLGGTGASVAAQQGDVTQRGGAAGLVAAVVQANRVVDVRVVDSFNTLRALNNILNNSPILSNNNVNIENVLSGNDIDISDVVTVGDVTITVEDLLDDVNVNIEDVVAIVELLSGGVVVVV